MNVLKFLAACLGVFLLVNGAELCPDNQKSTATCGSEQENCTTGYFCYNGTCCPSCHLRVQQLNTTRAMAGGFVPECDGTGGYLPEQCHYSKGACWCVTKFGEEIPNTRFTTSTDQQGKRDCDREREKYKRSATWQNSDSSIEILSSDNETTSEANQSMSSSQLLTPLRARNPSQERPGVCPVVKPGHIGPCLMRCLRDSDCPLPGFKCCSNGCGRDCKPAVISEGVEKPGHCERMISSSVLPSEPNGTCHSDSECPGAEKCCPNATGEFTCTLDFSNDTAAITVNIPNQYNDTCGPNTVVSPCARPCPIGCDQLAGPVCTPTHCVTGCECASGYVRHRANDTSSPCVELSSCSSTNASHLMAPSKFCSDPNSIWNDCGSACEETCHFKPTSCAKECVPACVCELDYVKESNKPNAKCVLRSQCRQSEMSQPALQCQDPNATWSTCGNPCVETCQGELPEICKTLSCVSGCFCRPGYVKEINDPRAKCILQRDCGLLASHSTIPQLQNHCSDPNSIFLGCGTACEETCQDRPTVCAEHCLPGCFCKPGYIKESRNGGAVCIRREQCGLHATPERQQLHCQDPNAVFKSCGSACVETCDIRPANCDSPCIHGCFCKEGYVKENTLTTARCVQRSQCGTLTPFGSQRPRCADPNSSWTFCGTACQSSCQNRNPKLCGRRCIAGCFCNDGYIKQSDAYNARCIPENACVDPKPGSQPSLEPQPTCADPNATWHSCGSACQETCQYRPPLCTLQCISGCLCNEGYVKESDAQNARCVPRSACGHNQQSGKVKPGLCPPLNANPYFGRPSRQDTCRSDSNCQSVLKCCNSLTGFVCVPPAGEEFIHGGIRTPSENQECGSNQQYNPCPPAAKCILTCDNFMRLPSYCNPSHCGPAGCQCRIGYVWNTRLKPPQCMPPYLCNAIFS